MASVRAVNHILQRRYLIGSGLPSSAFSCYFSTPPCVSQSQSYCTKRSITKVEEGDGKGQLTLKEVVKENTKSAGYLGVIIIGFGVTAVMFYGIFSELFSSKSPNSVYSKALDKCTKNPKVLDVLGEPLKAFGEETRRRRRTHVSHSYYMRNGVKHMRMRFYIQGTRKRGTVNLEVKENESGDYEFRYIYVKVDGILGMDIQVEDNRDKETALNPSKEPEVHYT